MKLNILSKLKSSLDYFVKNWALYLFTNLLYAIIGVLVAVLGIFILFFVAKDVKFPSLKLEIFLLVLWLTFIIFGLRLGKALSFVANFYIAKAYKNGEKLSFSQAFVMGFKGLKNRIILDFWYFLIFLALFLVLLVLFIIIDYIFESIIHISFSSFIILGISILVISIYFIVKIGLTFYLADYHCFDEDKFDFKTFLSTRYLIKGKYFYLLFNIIILFIVVYIISSIIMFLLFNWLKPDSDLSTLLSFYSTKELLFSPSIILMKLLSIKFVIHKLISYIVWIIVNIYVFNYFFLAYYEIKKDKEKQVSEE